MYDDVQLAQAVQQQMPEHRWKHTIGVMDTSVILAQHFGVNGQQAQLAALLHDFCKFWSAERQADVLREASDRMPADLSDVLEYDKLLWHAPAGAIIVNRDYGISDAEVLDAIRYHTTGRPHMTRLEKIVCLADYIEPGRDFPEVHKIREIAEHSLEKALLMALNSTLLYLIETNKPIYPLTLLARNSLLHEVTR